MFVKLKKCKFYGKDVNSNISKIYWNFGVLKQQKCFSIEKMVLKPDSAERHL